LDRRRNAEYKYDERVCGRCKSTILFLKDDKPSQCPDCEWQGYPWSNKVSAPRNPYDIPSDIKIPVPYSGPADGL